MSLHDFRVEPKGLASSAPRENLRLAPTAQMPTLILSFKNIDTTHCDEMLNERFADADK